MPTPPGRVENPLKQLVSLFAICAILFGCAAKSERTTPQGEPAPSTAAAGLPPLASGEEPAARSDPAAPVVVPGQSVTTSAEPPPDTRSTASGYEHDRFITLPMDIARTFAAFTLSFDGMDGGVCLGVPEWVAYELRAMPGGLGAAPERPRWTTDAALYAQKIAPDDASYRGSGYSRGHLCMKSHAHRISDDADRETHTVLNACPQLQGMNNGVWKAVEDLTGTWADTYGKVWIVAGPIFFANKQHQWIGDAGEVPVAIPDAFYKVVVKERGNTCDVLAFLIPMEGDEGHSKSSADVRPYLSSVDVLEALTGLDFLSSLPDALEESLEKRVHTALWPVPSSVAAVLAEDAPRAPPPAGAASQVPRETAAPQGQGDPLAGIALRGGVQPGAADELLAKKLRGAGWVYVMPRPKSAQASWGNTDGRTTWWSGHWRNTRHNTYSASQPKESDAWKGDGIQSTGWRRGGSPSRPTMIEWLCSADGGIPPR